MNRYIVKIKSLTIVLLSLILSPLFAFGDKHADEAAAAPAAEIVYDGSLDPNDLAFMGNFGGGEIIFLLLLLLLVFGVIYFLKNFKTDDTPNSNKPSQKEFFPVFLLCFFFGILGIHRFYLGKMGTGLLMAVTLGGFGIWALIDCILILTNNFRDSDGMVIMYRSTSSVPSSGVGTASEIETLSSLKDKGIITEEEFDIKKKQLLGL